MALSKVEFVNGPLEVFTVQDDKQENWMAANPFAEVLKYSRFNQAIQQHVSTENQTTLEKLRSHCSGAITSALHPQTKFINQAGVFELRSLDRLSVDSREIVFKSDYVPNAMNVLNKVKENLPKDKFKARHNKITLLEDLTKEDLVRAIDCSLTQRQVAIIAKNASQERQRQQ